VPDQSAVADQHARFSGILNLAKPAGWTSHDVVARVRRILGERRVGHAGTLDPMATGVLLVCVGQATRVAEYLTASEKVYRAVARLGLTTDTYDRMGQITATAPVPNLNDGDIQNALGAFTGDIAQIPPAYSAVKQAGVASYRRARRGESVVLPARPVTIFAIRLLEWRSPDAVFEVECSPGTYVRSLVHDLGQALRCGAHLAELARLRSGRFKIEDAVTLEALADAAAAGTVRDCLHPIEQALGHLVPVTVDVGDAARLVNGLPISRDVGAPGTTGYARMPGGSIAAILIYREGQWWPQKVFSPDEDRRESVAGAPLNHEA
jgi:tRNA pseudouridine55 synthase